MIFWRATAREMLIVLLALVPAGTLYAFTAIYILDHWIVFIAFVALGVIAANVIDKRILKEWKP